MLFVEYNLAKYILYNDKQFKCVFKYVKSSGTKRLILYLMNEWVFSARVPLTTSVILTRSGEQCVQTDNMGWN